MNNYTPVTRKLQPKVGIYSHQETQAMGFLIYEPPHLVILSEDRLPTNHYPIEPRGRMSHNRKYKIEVGKAASTGLRDLSPTNLQAESTYFDQVGTPILVLKTFRADIRRTFNQDTLLINLTKELIQMGNPVGIIQPLAIDFKETRYADQRFGDFCPGMTVADHPHKFGEV